jgi:hypothetical protein
MTALNLKEKPKPLVHPTPEEQANGWDAHTLSAYINNVEQDEAKRIIPEDKRKTVNQSCRSFNPHNW